MKWIDYREKLGICWDDDQKTTALQEKIGIAVDRVYKYLERRTGEGIEIILTEYFFTVAEKRIYMSRSDLCESITRYKSSPEIVSRYIAFVNSIAKHFSKAYAKDVESLLTTSLNDLNISYECVEDEDGIFIFPQGAPELDEALVSAPLEWLNDYPDSRKAWIKALKDYADQTDENASDIADKFRKALEQFLQEFFGSERSLENLIPTYCDYLKEHSVPAEISNDFQKLIKSYTDYMNNYAKHHDRTSRKVLEYIMYETGNVIRLLITLKQEDTSDAD